MGAGNANNSVKYYSIKKGKIALYDKAKQADDLFDYYEGTITGYKIETKEIQNKKKEFITLTIVDGDETAFLQFGVDSGYFRAFVNQIRTGGTDKRVRLTPQYSEDGAQKNSGMFVSPAGDRQKSFAWYSKKSDMKDVPVVKVINLSNGDQIVDRGEQTAFWKKWLETVKWGSAFEASAVQYDHTKVETPKQTNQPENISNSVDFNTDDDDDLPF